MIEFTQLRNVGIPMSYVLGLIPEFLSATNKLRAAQQIDFHYQHGGGWRPLKGWQRAYPEAYAIQYPGDPKLLPIAKAVLPLTGEDVLIYPHSWVGVFQKDGSFEVARLD